MKRRFCCTETYIQEMMFVKTLEAVNVLHIFTIHLGSPDDFSHVNVKEKLFFFFFFHILYILCNFFFYKSEIIVLLIFEIDLNYESLPGYKKFM
jgi:hypothetical protein